jgi:hypothetical protein
VDAAVCTQKLMPLPVNAFPLEFERPLLQPTYMMMEVMMMALILKTN